MNKRGFWTYCRGYTYFSSIADDFDTWSNHARAACTDVRRMHHYPKHHEQIVVVSSFYAVVLSAFSVGAVSGLQKNKSLKSLCLAACRLGNQGIALICIHRASWKFLEGFRLRDSLHNYRIVEHCWTFTYFNQFRRKCCWHTSKHWAPGWWDGLRKLFTSCRWKLTPLEGVGQLCAGPLANHFSFLGCESSAWNRGKLQRGHSETLTMSLTVGPVTPWICAAGDRLLCILP